MIESVPYEDTKYKPHQVNHKQYKLKPNRDSEPREFIYYSVMQAYLIMLHKPLEISVPKEAN